MENLESEQIRKRDVRRLAKIFGINFGLMLMSGTSGLRLDNYATLADSAHEAGDAGVMAGRAMIERNDVESKSWFQKYRRVSYAIVSAISLGIALKSSFELLDLLQGATHERSIQDRAKSIGIATVIAVGNNYARNTSQKLEGSSDNILDAKHHAETDWKASKMAVGFIAAGAVVPFVTEIGGMYVGGYTAVHMRPTKDNLEHHSHVHEH